MSRCTRPVGLCEAECSRCGLPFDAHGKRGREKGPTVFAGLDGEGRGRAPHRYVLLAYSDKTGTRKGYIQDLRGLSTKRCLDFLFDTVPSDVQLFGFSLGYDWTKILADLTDGQLYHLMRPELRQHAEGERREPHPVAWLHGYKLNLIGTRFIIQRGRRRRTIWDVFKFYQCKFVEALKLWKVLTEKQRERMSELKDMRGSELDKLPMSQVRAYCFSECGALAELVERLVKAHVDCGLELKSFYGAGSTSSAILEVMGIGDKRRQPLPEMQDAVARAFFGGRFEHSVIGAVRGPLHSFDISSAYPYACTQLPCLEHGVWELAKKRRELDRTDVSAALVHYALDKPKRDECAAWAPFPFRTEEGTIVFPARSGGGWVWQNEYRQGERLFSHVRFREAWVLRRTCNCSAPFLRIVEYYKERVKIGKEGPGIVLKLGPNGAYGKLAQSVGQAPPFQCWIWAGMITSSTRAQALELLGLHEDRRNLLAVATDGVYTRENLKTPLPVATGTDELPSPEGIARKPLGGWEHKIVEKGVFFARPGIYFPIDPTEEELKDCKARGIGRASLFAAHRAMTRAWRRRQEVVHIRPKSLTRFVGAKTGITVAGKGTIFHRSEAYGHFVPRPIILSLDPLPKRDGIKRNSHGYGTLGMRSFSADVMSAPYDRAVGAVAPEALLLKAAQDEADEQPDGGDLQYGD